MRAVLPGATGLIGNSKGGALIFVLLAVALFSVLGLGLAPAPVGDHAAANQSLGKVKARYAAEAGAPHALAEIRARLEAGTLLDEPGFNGAGELDEELSYSYTVENSAPNTFRVASRGEYRDFKAAVEAEVELLPEAAGYAIFCDGDLNFGTVAETTIRGNIHSNGHIRAGTVTGLLLDNFNLEGEAYAVDRRHSWLPRGYRVRQGAEIPMQEVDWERIRRNADQKNPSSLPLLLSKLLPLNVWLMPHVLDGQVVYFDGDVLLIGPLVGPGVIAVNGTAVVLLSGEHWSRRDDEGIMLAARDDVCFVLNILDLGSVLKTVLGVVGDLLDLLVGWLIPFLEKMDAGLAWNPDYYITGLLYAGDAVIGVGGIPTVHGTVIARDFTGLDVSFLFVHDPNLAKKLPAGKVYFKGSFLRIKRWEES